ncbi:hypothetical protein AGOR_G00238080 [Albula goreensis]|uniref:Chemokine interleukin-8-like domain-containing protein n=1 Tax=Albula goreensis TaxID=1534307 RepID=A0A8T3CCU6_9TELE|nr:hypothetical protein AGOR_G00238080 [Albula goreensis]
MQYLWSVMVMAMLLVSSVAAQKSNFRRPTKVTTSCCESVSKSLIPYTVKEYKFQNALGPCVEAVIFYTDKGAVCSDPSARWVQRKIKELPEREG